MPRYIYQRGGAPLLSWKNAPPQQTRASDTKALGGYESYPGGQLLEVAGSKIGQASGLGCSGCGGARSMKGFGSLAGTSLDGPTISMPLPRAGAPEPLPSMGAVYESDGGFRHPMRGPFGALPEATPMNLAIGAGVAYALYKIFKKKR